MEKQSLIVMASFTVFAGVATLRAQYSGDIVLTGGGSFSPPKPSTVPLLTEGAKPAKQCYIQGYGGFPVSINSNYIFGAEYNPTTSKDRSELYISEGVKNYGYGHLSYDFYLQSDFGPWDDHGHNYPWLVMAQIRQDAGSAGPSPAIDIGLKNAGNYGHFIVFLNGVTGTISGTSVNQRSWSATGDIDLADIVRGRWYHVDLWYKNIGRTDAFVRVQIKNGSAVIADQQRYATIGFTSITPLNPNTHSAHIGLYRSAMMSKQYIGFDNIAFYDNW